MRAIIIDDEARARDDLAQIVTRYCPRITVIAQAENVKTGISAISKFKPDLLFLDVQMPDGTGFDLLKRVDALHLKVIFTTGFEEFAIKAFRFSALDYILKPIDPAELVSAVEKAFNAAHKDNLSMKCYAFMANTAATGSQSKKMVVKTAASYNIVEVSDIVRCEADGNYTNVYFNNGTRLLDSKTLKEYEELLREHGFFRIHKSHLINLAYISNLEKAKNGNVGMKDDSTLPVAPQKRKHLQEVINRL